jgi:hypothetical protein
MHTQSLDLYAAAQDALTERLCAGRLNTRQLSAAHAQHVAILIAAGFGYDEAAAAFWDAVHAAQHVRAQEEATT